MGIAHGNATFFKYQGSRTAKPESPIVALSRKVLIAEERRAGRFTWNVHGLSRRMKTRKERRDRT
jgi:hypothetical protein